MGYRTVGHYAGGIREWRRANLTFDIGHQRSVHTETRGTRHDTHPPV
jgi:hypothetical protein